MIAPSEMQQLHSCDMNAGFAFGLAWHGAMDRSWWDRQQDGLGEQGTDKFFNCSSYSRCRDFPSWSWAGWRGARILCRKKSFGTETCQPSTAFLNFGSRTTKKICPLSWIWYYCLIRESRPNLCPRGRPLYSSKILLYAFASLGMGPATQSSILGNGTRNHSSEQPRPSAGDIGGSDHHPRGPLVRNSRLYSFSNIPPSLVHAPCC